MSRLSKTTIFYPCLESLRGIAAIAVLFYHFQRETVWALIPFIAHGDIFVDFFFILSGFVIVHVYGRKLRNRSEVFLFVKKRFLRLYPLHFFILTFFFLNSLVAPNFEFDFEKTTMLINQYLLVQVVPPVPFYFPALYWNHPSWSISAEFWTYLLFIPLLIRPDKRIALIVAVLAYAVIGLKMGTLLRTDVFGDDYLLLRCVAGFSFGIFLYITKSFTNRFQKVSFWLDIVLLSTVTGCFLVLSSLPIGTHFFIEISLIIFFGLIIIRATKDDFILKSLLESPPLLWIGKISYSIYLSHILVGFYIYRIADKLLGTEVNSVFIRNILPFLVLVICLIFSSFTYQFIERRLRYKRKPNKSVVQEVV